MSFTTTNRDGTPVATVGQSEAAKSARDRAVAALLGQNPDAPAAPEAPKAAAPASDRQPVSNPTQVAPEEMTAIQSPTQTDTGEATSTATPPPAEEPKAPAAPDIQLSKQHAILARKERQIRQQMQELKARETALASQEAERQKALAPKPVTLDDLRARVQNDPLEIGRVMQELGIGYEQAANLMLNQPNPTESALHQRIREQDAKIEKLLQGQDETRKQFESTQKQAYDQALNQIRNEAKAQVTADPRFELVKETNSVEDVVELIRLTFEKEGTLLTVEEASQAVEDHLTEEAFKLAKSKKIQAKLQEAAKPANTEPKKPGAQEQAKQTQPTKTLTNAMSTPGQMNRRERAIAAFKGQLK